MVLTEKEKELFTNGIGTLFAAPSDRITDGLIQSYRSNNDIVQTTFGYIKRMLLEVAKKRNLVISSDIERDN